MKKQGVENVQGLGQGGTAAFDFGKVKMVNAVHGSRMPDNSPGGFPVGFVVETADGNFYHAGDTALTMDMQLIAHWTRLNWAALPIGDHYTMGVADAVRAADFVGCHPHPRVALRHFSTAPHRPRRRPPPLHRRREGTRVDGHRPDSRSVAWPTPSIYGLFQRTFAAARASLAPAPYLQLSLARDLAAVPGVRHASPCSYRCGAPAALRDWFTPLDGCPRCGYAYDREPGYFLLALWGINYGVSSVVGICIAVWIFVFHADWSYTKTLLVVALPLLPIGFLFIRHAKAYFLAIDHPRPIRTFPRLLKKEEAMAAGGGGRPPKPVAPVDDPGEAWDPAGMPGSGIEREREARAIREAEEAGSEDSAASEGCIPPAYADAPIGRNKSAPPFLPLYLMASPVTSDTPERFATLVSVMLILIVVAVLYVAKEIFVPLALALMFSFVLAPLVTRFERWKLGRVPSCCWRCSSRSASSAEWVTSSATNSSI